MKFLQKFFFNNKYIPANFFLFYIISGLAGIFFFDNLMTLLFQYDSMAQIGPLALGVLFLISTGIILFVMLNHMKRVVQKIDTSYRELKEKDKQRLIPYEFALNNSIDAIYWFTIDAKVIYINDAACEMLGYTQEEFLNKNLEDIDPNFDRQSAIKCMHTIRNEKDWRLETTQKKKDDSIFTVEVSGHAFQHGGIDYICAFGRDMTQKLKYRTKITTMNQELQKSLEEKDILLKEIHHRVKNNMEIISSLFNMQERRTDDKDMIYILKQSRSRIHTMALVHEFLYLGENLAYINLPNYIKQLVQDIKELYLSQNTKLEVDLHIDKLTFSTNRCIQIGMVLHELCVNALKYAFKENRNNLLCLHIKTANDKIYVKIRDNGDGLHDISCLYKGDSIGMQLIHSIVEDQLEGTIEFTNNNGLECNIVFSKDEEE